MATIQDRIEGRVGEAAGGDIGFTATSLQDAYNHGLRTIIAALPERAWKFFGKSKITFSPLTGTEILTDKIIDVLRDDDGVYRKCEMIDADMAGPAADQNSIHYASTFTPVAYIDSGTYSNPRLKILPEGPGEEGLLVTVGIPTVDITTDTVVPHFPDELEELPELSAAIWVKQREMGVSRRDSQDELEAITSSGYLEDFQNDLPVYVNPSEPVMPTATLTPMAALPTLTMSSATDSWPTLSLSPTIVMPTLTLPTMTALPTYVPITGPTIGTLSITNKAITDPGTLSMPSAPTLPTLVLTQAPDFTDLDLSGISPTSNTVDYTSAGSEPASTVTVGTSVPTYGASPVFTYSSTIIDAALLNATNIIGNSGINTNTDVETLLDGQYIDAARTGIEAAAAEINLAATSIRDQQSQLQEYAEEVREAVGSMNAQVAAYQADAQQEVAEVQAGIAAYVAKAQDSRNDLEDDIAQARQDNANHTAEANAIVQEWVSEEVQFKLGKWSTQVQAEIGEFSSQVSAVLGDFQAQAVSAVSEFNANVNRQIREFEVEMQADTIEWTEQKKADLDKYRVDVQNQVTSYQAEVAAFVSEYQAKAAALTAEFQANVVAQVQQYTAIVTAEIGAYRAQIEAYLGELQTLRNSELQEYQSKAGTTISEYQSLNTAILGEFGNKVNSAISEYQALVQARLGEFQAELSRAVSRLQQAGVRLQTMQNFDQKSAMALNEARDLREEFNFKLRTYIAPFIESPERTFVRDRRRA